MACHYGSVTRFINCDYFANLRRWKYLFSKRIVRPNYRQTRELLTNYTIFEKGKKLEEKTFTLLKLSRHARSRTHR